MALATEIGQRISMATVCVQRWAMSAMSVETLSPAQGSAICYRREKVELAIEMHKKEHEPDRDFPLVYLE